MYIMIAKLIKQNMLNNTNPKKKATNKREPVLIFLE